MPPGSGKGGISLFHFFSGSGGSGTDAGGQDPAFVVHCDSESELIERDPEDSFPAFAVSSGKEIP